MRHERYCSGWPFLLLLAALGHGNAQGLSAANNSSSAELDTQANTSDAGYFERAEEDYSYDDIYADADDNYTPEQAAIVSYLPKPFSLLSMICSYVIVREVFKEERRGGRIGGTPINRMLLGMAVGDIFFSFMYFLGPWMSPPVGAYGLEGSGTVATCTLQGFFYQLGLGVSVFSNASLSIFYYLMICRNWSDRDLQEKELLFHGMIWITALGLAIYPIPLELYNSNGEVCWIDSVPANCSGDDCIRGTDPWGHQLALLIIPFVCLVVNLVNMGMIMCKVRQVENTASRYAGSTTTRPSNLQAPTTISGGVSRSVTDSGDSEGVSHLRTSDGTVRVSRARDSTTTGKSPTWRDSIANRTSNVGRRAVRSSTANRKKSNAVAWQALWYTAAFLCTYLLDFVVSCIYYVSDAYYPHLEYIAYGVLLPSAGIFNFLVFSRQRRMKSREGSFLKCIFFCLCCREPMDTISSRFSRSRASSSVDASTTEKRVHVPPTVDDGTSNTQTAPPGGDIESHAQGVRDENHDDDDDDDEFATG